MSSNQTHGARTLAPQQARGARQAGAVSVSDSGRADAATDTSALRELAAAYGERALRLPPVALVIAAYNEEGAVGPVVEALPRTVCGLAAEVIVDLVE